MSKGTQLSDRPTVLNSAYSPAGVWVYPLRCGNTLPSQHKAGVESCVPAGTCHGRDAVVTKQWGECSHFCSWKDRLLLCFSKPFRYMAIHTGAVASRPSWKLPSPLYDGTTLMQTGGPLCRRRSSLLMDN